MSDEVKDQVEELEARVKELQKQAKDDRKLISRAADVLGEIDRNDGLGDEHADVLAALRIRIEGKPRKSLDDLLTAAGPIAGKKDLGDVLGGGAPKPPLGPFVIRKFRRRQVLTSNTTARNVVTPLAPTPSGTFPNARFGVLSVIDSGGRNCCIVWRITRAQTGQNGP